MPQSFNAPDFASVDAEFAVSSRADAVQASKMFHGNEIQSCSLDRSRGTFTIQSYGYQAVVATSNIDEARNIVSMVGMGRTIMRSYEESGRIVIVAVCGDWMYRVRGVVSSVSHVA
jgi:hypothetical protein